MDQINLRMATNLDEITYLVSSLGLDTDVFKKLSYAQQANIIPVNKYSHILEKIWTIASTNNIKTKNLALNRLLLQLTKLVHNDLKKESSDRIDYTKIREIISQNQQPVPDITNSKLMELLGNMAKKLDDLDKKESVVIQSNPNYLNKSTELDILLPTDNVFINPIDQKELSKIKSNVKIESKSDSNIKDKLNKLKKLKGKNNG